MKFTSISNKLAIYTQFNNATEYDPITGLFTWKFVGGTQRVAGAVVGASTVASGHLAYSYYSLTGRFPISLHQAAWLRTYGNLPIGHIDHIDCNPKNNSIKNLRDIPSGSNYHNRMAQVNNTSGLSGVSWDKSRSNWIVGIKHKGVKLHIGRYLTIFDAACALIKKRAQLGYIVRPGQPT